MRLLLPLIATAVLCSEENEKKEIKIGAIFNGNDVVNEVALKEAARRITQFSKKYNVTVLTRRLRDNDSYQVSKTICDLVEEGVRAIIGPETPTNSEIVQSIAVKMQLPNFQPFWNPNILAFNKENFEHPIMTFNLHPDRELPAAIATYVRESDWKSYAVIYENDDSLPRLQEVLKSRKPSDMPIFVKKMGEGGDYRPLLKALKAVAQYQIIIDSGAEKSLELLRQAFELKGMLGDYSNYILTSLDTHTLDFREFRNTGTNITSFRIVDVASPYLDDATRDWERSMRKHSREKFVREHTETTTALLYDALNLFVSAYGSLETQGEEFEAAPLNCFAENVSSFGAPISNYLLKNPFHAGPLPGPLTGKIQFNEFGQRVNYELKLLELDASGFKETGSWKSEKPKEIQSKVSTQELETKITEHIKKKVFRVASKTGDPYLILKTSNGTRELVGNDRYEGYSIDLIDGIAKILNFSYEFYLVPDNAYGSYHPETKQWDGLIRELKERKADLAVCDLTITYERRREVDFTSPFMTLGISILYSKAKKEPPSLFSFLEPLALDVWVCTATAYLLLTIMVFLVARLARSDWENPHPCNPEPEELENIWNVKNCLWLTLGSIMAQGCDILPKGISTRMVTSMWWFFSLIMTACYTANLAAFLTMERMGPTIESAEDLVKQTKIKYGCVEGAATYAFFKNSNVSTYHRMWTQMINTEPSVFERKNEEGVKRVLTSKGLYAFMMESTTLEYEMEKNCDLIQVGRWLETKHYGIGMPINAQYRTLINQAVLKMQESGELHRLKEKWWKQKNQRAKCEKSKTEGDQSTAELSLSNVGGVFVVLVGGIVLALLVAVCEFLWNVRKLAVVRHLTWKEAFDLELRFALNIKIRKKAVAPSTTANQHQMLTK